MESILNFKKFMLLGFSLCVLYFFPYFILGSNSYVHIHDNFDHQFLFQNLLIKDDLLTAKSNLEVSFANLTRSSFSTEISFISVLSYFFNPFWVYIINLLSAKIFAFVGFIYLCKDYLFKKENFLPVFGASISFAFLPFFGTLGIGIASVPIFLWSLFNIYYNKNKIISCFIIFITPLFASLLTIYFFVYILLGLFILYEITKKRFNLRFFILVFISGLVFMFAEYRTFESLFFGESFISNRSEYDWMNFSFLRAAASGFFLLIDSYIHVESFHKYLILPLITIISFFIFIKKIEFKYSSLLIFLFTFCFLSALNHSFWFWEGSNILTHISPLFGQFNFSRLSFLNPIAWYLIFTILLIFINKTFSKKASNLIISTFIFIQLSINGVYNHEYFRGERMFDIKLDEYLSEDIFKNFHNTENVFPKEYYSISIGLHPTLASYNGFKTFDFHSGSYPIEKKHEFLRIFGNQLNKDQTMFDYIDDWGGRLYVLTPELKKDFYSGDSAKVSLTLNNELMKSKKIKYIISRAELNNNYKILNKSSNDHWTLYLYEIY